MCGVIGSPINCVLAAEISRWASIVANAQLIVVSIIIVIGAQSCQVSANGWKAQVN